MPLSTSRPLPRRAPATESATAHAATSKVRTRMTPPSAAIAASSASARRWCASFGFVLRRALGHHAVRRDGEALLAERALEHHLGVVFERVRDDARVRRIDDLAVAVHLEAILERPAIHHHRVG